MNVTFLLVTVLFGSIGLGYFIYGRKQKSPLHFISGIALFGCPYLVDSTMALVLIGATLVVLPLTIKR
ncbi:MAG: hypothetical protein V3T18_03170 [Pseudomonadales bacterium]